MFETDDLNTSLLLKVPPNISEALLKTLYPEKEQHLNHLIHLSADFYQPLQNFIQTTNEFMVLGRETAQTLFNLPSFISFKEKMTQIPAPIAIFYHQTFIQHFFDNLVVGNVAYNQNAYSLFFKKEFVYSELQFAMGFLQKIYELIFSVLIDKVSIDIEKATLTFHIALKKDAIQKTHRQFDHFAQLLRTCRQEEIEFHARDRFWIESLSQEFFKNNYHHEKNQWSTIFQFDQHITRLMASPLQLLRLDIELIQKLIQEGHKSQILSRILSQLEMVEGRLGDIFHKKQILEKMIENPYTGEMIDLSLLWQFLKESLVYPIIPYQGKIKLSTQPEFEQNLHHYEIPMIQGKFIEVLSAFFSAIKKEVDPRKTKKTVQIDFKLENAKLSIEVFCEQTTLNLFELEEINPSADEADQLNFQYCKTVLDYYKGTILSWSPQKFHFHFLVPIHSCEKSRESAFTGGPSVLRTSLTQAFATPNIAANNFSATYSNPLKNVVPLRPSKKKVSQENGTQNLLS